MEGGTACAVEVWGGEGSVGGGFEIAVSWMVLVKGEGEEGMDGDFGQEEVLFGEDWNVGEGAIAVEFDSGTVYLLV